MILPNVVNGDIDIDRNAEETCVDKLGHAHMYMKSLNATTMIAYLNEENDTEKTRSYIHKYYIDTFNLYYSLYDNIKDEYFWDSGCKLRWPVGWYLAHAASFYNNKLKLNNIINRTNINSSLNALYEEYDHLFAQGVDEMSWDDFVPQYPIEHWPNVHSVKMYCIDTKNVISNIILTTPLTSLPINRSATVWWTILMGIEHERIHLETSAMLIRQLSLNKFKDIRTGVWNNEYENSIEIIPPANELISVNGKEIRYGRQSDLLQSNNDFFGWDTEYGTHTVNVSSFNASKYMVSNHEYYQFYTDKGYQQKKYWSQKAWKWLQQTNTKYPKFWIKFKQINDNNSVNNIYFKLRNLLSEIDLIYAWNKPVITNHYEAEAFVSWKSEKIGKTLRLITEDEWYLLRTLKSLGKYNIREWSIVWANINYQYYTTEVPINLFEFGDSGFFDIVGNLHHHTSSFYHPFNNYSIDPLYVDFSTPFFNHSYYIMKGGSYLSSGNMAMIYNRCQWFRGHYFQAAGIRYVESSNNDNININKISTNEYFRNTAQSDELLNEEIHFQYSKLVDNYRQSVIDIIDEYIGNHDQYIYNILHIGCNVGGVTYELATYFNNYNGYDVNIFGIDDRERMIGIGNQIKQNYKLEYFMKNKYGKNKYHSVSLKELQMENITNKVRFIHDQNLHFTFNNNNNQKYDLIIGHGVFDRYHDELKLNNGKISNIMNNNGTIILFEDYSWNKNEVDVLHTISNILGDKFQLTQQFDVPIIYRQKYESSRKRLAISLHCTIWMKVD